MPPFEPPRATRDFPPEQTAVRRRVRELFEQTAELYGFEAVQTPAFERVELFLARSGPEIKSSLLTFHCDHEEFALRPELTAPVCRMLASGALDGRPLPHKLSYLGPCFRYTRPHSGRYRESTQAGVECIGEAGPAADAEIIAAALRFLRSLKISGFTLRIGTVAIFRELLPDSLDAEDRNTILGHLDRLNSIDEKARQLGETRSPALFEDLKMDRRELAALQAEIGYEGTYAIEQRPQLSLEECAEALPREAEATFRAYWQVEDLLPDEVTSVLLPVSRLRGPLAEVESEARSLLGGAPAAQALDHLVSVCRHVEMYSRESFEVVLGIARGFTFYTSTVFEMTAPGPAGPRKYCGGGRYDRLIEEFGGASLPAAGCAFPFDELADLAAERGGFEPAPPYQVLLVAPEPQALPRAVQAAEELRGRGVRTGVSREPRSGPQAQPRRARWFALLDESGDKVWLTDGAVTHEAPLDAAEIAAKTGPHS